MYSPIVPIYEPHLHIGLMKIYMEACRDIIYHHMWDLEKEDCFGCIHDCPSQKDHECLLADKKDMIRKHATDALTRVKKAEIDRAFCRLAWEVHQKEKDYPDPLNHFDALNVIDFIFYDALKKLRYEPFWKEEFVKFLLDKIH